MNSLGFGLSFGLLVAVSCGGDSENTTGGNAGGSDTGAGGASSSVGSATGSGASSTGSGSSGSGGATTCLPGEVHVLPCCGGPAPRCEPLPDGGTCPAGTHPADCPDGPGCEMDPCVAPPPYCAQESDLKCADDNCSTVNGDCSGYLQDGKLSCECA